MMKRFILTLIVSSLFFAGQGQDPHFSQFNASPLTLNPALAGKVSCNYRAAVNYRSQWNSIPANFETYTATFDAALWKDGWLNGSALGVGVKLMNDQSGDGNLTNPNLGLFLGYHQKIGENSFLSAGFEGSFNELRVDPTKLIFPNQISNSGIQSGAPHNENLLGETQFFDINAGIHWSSIVSDEFSFSLGGAMYHITEPKLSLLNQSNIAAKDNLLYRRYVGHGGFSAALGENYSLSPSILYMQQANVDQLTAGTSFGVHFDDATLFLGTWLRMHLLDAAGADDDPFYSSAIALVGAEFNTLILGFSYDLGIGALANNVTQNPSGFELSLQYTGCFRSAERVMHCPTF